METIQINHTQIPLLPNSVACIGYFDGMHLGHQALISRTIELAKKQGMKPALITFDPDPWKIFYPDRQVTHMFTLEDKKRMANQLGIELFYCVTFTRPFSQLSTDQFHELLHEMHVQTLVCGFDFHYGVMNSGSVETLHQQKLFHVSVVDSINAQAQKISSSRIEPLIVKGAVDQASYLLGYYYSVAGEIVHGFHRGTSLLKIPTANLQVNEEYIWPCVGVYAGYVEVDDVLYPAMINIGKNPTFENKSQTMEAHIFDFKQDIYGKQARFYFATKTRGEIKFESIEGLIAQLNQDIQTCKEALRNLDDMQSQTLSIWNKTLFRNE